MRSQIFSAITAFLLGLSVLVYGATASDGDTKFTQKERQALDELSPQVSPFMRSNFTKSDIHLVHWLHENNLDVEATRKALLATSKWRKENRIADTVLEDWSAFESKFPANIEGRDREGRPVLLLSGNAWNVRKAVMSGRMDVYKRFLVRTVVELPLQTLESMYDAEGSGHNVSQYIFIMDLHGINVREQICMQCLAAWAYLMSTGEEHYPRLAFRTFFINAPRAFDLVQNVVQPLMSEHSRGHKQIFDHDRSKWQPVLLNYVNPDQLPPRFGGTKQKNSKPESTVATVPSQTIEMKIPVTVSNATIISE